MNTENEICVPCFAYPGGKRKMLARLLAMIPPHKTYCEPFAGGLAVLLGKPPSKCEVVNDLNRDLVLFYRYARMHCDALLSELSAMPVARAELEFFKCSEPETELERAARFFWRSMNTFGAMGSRFSRRKDRAPHWASDVIRQRIVAVRDRLKRVYVECRPANEVIQFFDTEETFFFVDPPYIEANPTRYAAFTREQMTELRDVLDACKGSWILTCDNSAACREVFRDFRTELVGNVYSLSGKYQREIEELVVFSHNYRFAA